MGYELYRHVLNHAPDDLDPAARLVLAVIADDANERTRKSYLGMPLLAHRAGMQPDTVGKALRRLAKAGFEIRVPIGKSKSGKPVYAAKGNRTTYLIPVFPEREYLQLKPGWESDLSDQSPDEKQTFEDAKPGREGAKVGRGSAKVGREADPPPQSPQSPHGGDAPDPDVLFEQPATPPKAAKRATSAPETFPITDTLRQWARTRTPLVDIDAQTEIFLDHHRAKGTTFKDWTAAWRTWMNKQQQWTSQRGGHLRALPGGQVHTGIRNEWMNRR
jgi:hypothetical protein